DVRFEPNLDVCTTLLIKSNISRFQNYMFASRHLCINQTPVQWPKSRAPECPAIVESTIKNHDPSPSAELRAGEEIKR
ncbi:MAG: hypothetical protein QXQ65_00550, partial [Conexivisphaerales archaeon]